MKPVWEFYKGFAIINAGERANGTTRTVLVIETMRVLDESDAKALLKEYPSLKARKITGETTAPWPKARKR